MLILLLIGLIFAQKGLTVENCEHDDADAKAWCKTFPRVNETTSNADTSVEESELDQEEANSGERHTGDRKPCKSANYYYGVVSTELDCPDPACLDEGSIQCKKESVNEVCRDGTGSKGHYCDPMVEVYRAHEYHCQGRQGMPLAWLMVAKQDTNRAYLQDHITTRTQWLRRVEEKNVDSEHCGKMIVRVQDADSPYSDTNVKLGRRRPNADKLSKYFRPTLLPYNKNEAMGKFFSHTVTYRTTIGCGNSGKEINIKVNFVVAFMKIVESDGTVACTKTDMFDCNTEKADEEKMAGHARYQIQKMMENSVVKNLKFADHAMKYYTYVDVWELGLNKNIGVLIQNNLRRNVCGKAKKERQKCQDDNRKCHLKQPCEEIKIAVTAANCFWLRPCTDVGQTPCGR